MHHVSIQCRLTCCLCYSSSKDTFDTPIKTKCGHVFCKDCIEQHIRVKSDGKYNKGSNEKPVCPCCAEPVTKRSLVPVEQIEDAVKQVKLIIGIYEEKTGRGVLNISDGPLIFSQDQSKSISLIERKPVLTKCDDTSTDTVLTSKRTIRKPSKYSDSEDFSPSRRVSQNEATPNSLPRTPKRKRSLSVASTPTTPKRQSERVRNASMSSKEGEKTEQKLKSPAPVTPKRSSGGALKPRRNNRSMSSASSTRKRSVDEVEENEDDPFKFEASQQPAKKRTRNSNSKLMTKQEVIDRLGTASTVNDSNVSTRRRGRPSKASTSKVVSSTKPSASQRAAAGAKKKAINVTASQSLRKSNASNTSVGSTTKSPKRTPIRIKRSKASSKKSKSAADGNESDTGKTDAEKEKEKKKEPLSPSIKPRLPPLKMNRNKSSPSDGVKKAPGKAVPPKKQTSLRERAIRSSVKAAANSKPPAPKTPPTTTVEQVISQEDSPVIIKKPVSKKKIVKTVQERATDKSRVRNKEIATAVAAKIHDDEILALYKNDASTNFDKSPGVPKGVRKKLPLASPAVRELNNELLERDRPRPSVYVGPGYATSTPTAGLSRAPHQSPSITPVLFGQPQTPQQAAIPMAGPSQPVFVARPQERDAYGQTIQKALDIAHRSPSSVTRNAIHSRFDQILGKTTPVLNKHLEDGRLSINTSTGALMMKGQSRQANSPRAQILMSDEEPVAPKPQRKEKQATTKSASDKEKDDNLLTQIANLFNALVTKHGVQGRIYIENIGSFEIDLRKRVKSDEEVDEDDNDVLQVSQVVSVKGEKGTQTDLRTPLLSTDDGTQTDDESEEDNRISSKIDTKDVGTSVVISQLSSSVSVQTDLSGSVVLASTIESVAAVQSHGKTNESGDDVEMVDKVQDVDIDATQIDKSVEQDNKQKRWPEDEEEEEEDIGVRRRQRKPGKQWPMYLSDDESDSEPEENVKTGHAKPTLPNDATIVLHDTSTIDGETTNFEEVTKDVDNDSTQIDESVDQVHEKSDDVIAEETHEVALDDEKQSKDATVDDDDQTRNVTINDDVDQSGIDVPNVNGGNGNTGDHVDVFGVDVDEFDEDSLDAALEANPDLSAMPTMQPASKQTGWRMKEGTGGIRKASKKVDTVGRVRHKVSQKVTISNKEADIILATPPEEEDDIDDDVNVIPDSSEIDHLNTTSSFAVTETIKMMNEIIPESDPEDG